MEIAALGLRVDGAQGIGEAADSLERLGAAAEKAEKKTGGITESSKKAKDALAEAARSTQRFNSAMASAADRAKALVVELGAVALAAAGLKAATQTLAGFEQSMASVGAITRASSKDMKAMREEAKRLGVGTEFSASQAADGFMYLGLAGWDAQQSIAAIPSVVDLATAASLGLADAADITSNIMSAYTIAADGASGVTDILAGVSSRANTDVMQLGEAMKYVGPVAASLEISVGDTAAALGVLADASIQGSMGGTALRSVLTNMIKPTADAQKALASMGLTVSDINPVTNDFADIVQKLADKSITAEEAVRIFGLEGSSAILALTAAEPKLKSLTDETKRMGDEAQRMADTMRDNLKGDLLGLESALEGIVISLGEAGLTSALRAAAQTATFFLREASAAINYLGGHLPAIGVVFAATLGPKVFALASAGVAAFSSVVVASMRAITVAMVANPMTSVFAAATIAASLLIKKIELTERAVDSLDSAAVAVRQSFSDIVSGITATGDSLAEPWLKLDGIVDKTMIAVLGYGDHWINTTIGSLNVLYVAFKTSFYNIGAEIVNVFVEAASIVTTFVDGAAGLLSKLGIDVSTNLTGWVQGGKLDVVDFGAAVSNAWNSAKVSTMQSRYETEKTLLLYERFMQTPVAETVEEITGETQKNTRALADNSKSLKAGEQAYKALVKAAMPYESAVQQLAKNTAILDKALKKGQVTNKQYTATIADLESIYKKAVIATVPHIKAIDDEVGAAQSSVRSLRQRVDAFGMTASAVARTALAETSARVATLEAIKATQLATGASTQYIEQLELEIDALRRLQIQQEHLVGLESTNERQQAEKQHYDDLSAEAKRAHDEIERSLTDALMRGFESGEGFGKNFINTLKNMFASLVLRPIIQPIAAGAAGMITGALGLGGAAQAQGAGGIDPITGLSTAKDMMGGLNWVTDFSGSMGNSLMDAGMYLQKFDGIVGDFGNTILGNIDTIAGAAQMAGAAWNYGKGIYDITQGNWGSGIGAIGGQLIGGPVGGMIGSTLGSMVDKMFGSGETRVGGGFGYDAATGSTRFIGGPSGGYGDQQTVSAIGNLFESATQGINRLFEALNVNAQATSFLGSFEGSEKGRGGTQSHAGLWVDGVQTHVGSFGKGSGYGGTSGSPEEMFENMVGDMQLTILEAWQTAADQMPDMIGDMLSGLDVRSLNPEQAGQAIQEIEAIVGAVTTLSAALDQMPIANLTGLAFDATASLIGLMGGLEGATQQIGAYYENFYTEAERAQHTTDMLTQEFGRLNIAVPDSRESFRELVNGIDLSSEQGRGLYAELMGLSGAFASVVDWTGEVISSAEDLQKAASEHTSLERQRLEIQGDTAAIRQLDLSALEESNHALQEHVWALQDEAAAAQERSNLETQLLRLTGDTAAIRAIELSQLDESNRGLQERIWALEDEANVVKNSAAYYRNFHTEGENVKRSTDNLIASMSALGVRLPQTRGGFRDLVESLDISTEAGKRLQESLMGLSGAASDFYHSVEEVARLQTELRNLPLAQVRDLSSEAAKSLSAMAGGTSGLISSLNFFYQNFYTEAERQEIAAQQLTSRLAEMNLALPRTRDGFRNLVEGMNLGTEAGRKMYASLLELSGAASEFYGLSEKAASNSSSGNSSGTSFVGLHNMPPPEGWRELAQLIRRVGINSESAENGREHLVIPYLGESIERSLGSITGVLQTYQNFIRDFFSTEEIGRIFGNDKKLTQNPMEAAGVSAQSRQDVVDFMRSIDVASAAGQKQYTQMIAWLGNGAEEYLKRIDSINSVMQELSELPFARLRDISFEAAESIISLSGGIEGLRTGIAAYNDAFYSEAEQHEKLLQQLQIEFSAFNYTLPETREGFRHLVEGLDLTTKHGQRMFAVMMSSADEAAEVYTYLEAEQQRVAQNLEQAQQKAAQTARERAQERLSLEMQILQLQGDTAAIRAIELREIDASNRALQLHIWALEDHAEAVEQAQQKAAQTAQERLNLEMQLLQLQGDTAAIRAIELREIDASNRALQLHIWALEDHAEAVEQAQQKAAQTAQERLNLEMQLLQLQGDTAAIRAIELREIDASNRALQLHIWALEDHAEAVEQARQREADALNESISKISEKLGELNSLSSAIDAGLDSLRGFSDVATQMHRDASRDIVAQATKMAQAGKSLVGFDGLTDAVGALSQLDASNFTSLFDYEMERAESANALNELGELTGGQIDVQELQLTALEEQLERLDSWKGAQLSQENLLFEEGQTELDRRLAETLEQLQGAQDKQLSQENLLFEEGQTELDRRLAETLEQLQGAQDKQLSQENLLFEEGQTELDRRFAETLEQLQGAQDKQLSQENLLFEEGQTELDRRLAETLEQLQGVQDEQVSQAEHLVLSLTAISEKEQVELDRRLDKALVQLQLMQTDQEVQSEHLTAWLSTLFEIAQDGHTQRFEGTVAQLQAMYEEQSALSRLVESAQLQQYTQLNAIESAIGRSASQIAAAVSKSSEGSRAGEFDRWLRTVQDKGGYVPSSILLRAREQFDAGRPLPNLINQKGGFNTDAFYRYINGYADGGRYPGGLALVGEEGPELINFSQPGMVYTAAQSRDLITNAGVGADETAGLLRQLVGEIREMRHELRQIAVNTQKTNKMLDDVTQGGTTLRTEVFDGAN